MLAFGLTLPIQPLEDKFHSNWFNYSYDPCVMEEHQEIKKYGGKPPKNLGKAFQKSHLKDLLATLYVKINHFFEKFKRDYLGLELFLEDPFKFITDSSFKKILIADYKELHRCFKYNCIKSGFLLSGGIIETLLIEQLKKDRKRADQAILKRHYKYANTIEKLKAYQLIELASDLQILTPLHKKLSDVIRDYRNIIHPEFQVRKKYDPTKEKLKLIITLLNSILKQLSY